MLREDVGRCAHASRALNPCRQHACAAWTETPHLFKMLREGITLFEPQARSILVREVRIAKMRQILP